MYQQEKTPNKVYEKKLNITNVEKATLQNNKIPSKSNYETIPPRTHSQMNRNTVNI